MAIVKMQKLSICANKKDRKRILELLQRMGNMEMTFTDIEDDPDLQKMDTQTARSKYEKRAQAFEQVLDLLKKYAPEKTGLFSQKMVVDDKDLDQAVNDRHKYNLEAARILRAEKKISECQGTIQRDENAKDSLAPWMDLDIPLSAQDTHSASILIGTVPGAVTGADLYAAAIKDLGEAPAVSVDVISTVHDLTYVTVLCKKDITAKVEENLRSIGFARPSQMVNGIPKDVCAGYDAEIVKMNAEIEAQKADIASFAGSRQTYKILADYYRTRAEKYRLLGSIPQSENVFFVEGWVPADQVESMAKLLTERFGAVVDTEAAAENETEPTLLRNNAFAQPAESILESYGLPQTNAFDPTFIMMIFYVIFFGMMLSDAAYGIVITVATFIILKKYPRLDDGMKKMMKLFFWCGLSTTFWGFMYGGFFGDVIDIVAKTFFGVQIPEGGTLLPALWFVPLKDPMRLLMYSMLFGLIHMFVGMIIKGYECVMNKDWMSLFVDVICWSAFVLGLVFLLLPTELFAGISQMHFEFPGWVGLLAKVGTFGGMLGILLFSGRASKNFVIRLALGAYDIYNVTGWLSDVLSYSRLLALGLATGVIASVINQMGSMFGGGVIGAILFIVVFLVGHVLNLAINMLGAYVHTTRLQYVEFFGKFYEGGGKKFTPFTSKNKYMSLKEEK